ncbi:hypothetical protein QJU87_04195 [Pasteurella skyensis]|uniref:hypothetical protein n=1 Tax=Phocoenobacter skyensis TaxID=97481 RepID=UPI002751C0DA|nr:hypothetical protein [Pasteurella skyensis]MDP8189065.1 hypothetical protein [Pasteurella skyensis]
MKRRTLFKISSYHTDIVEVKNSLNETTRSNLDTLIEFIRKKIGSLKSVVPYCYRVTNMNYVKLHFIGTKLNDNEEESTEFHLILVLAGYTEFPLLALESSTRLNMSVTDTTDAFWLTELLRYELSEDK